MADSTYHTFAGKLSKALKGKDQSAAARASGLTLQQVGEAVAGSFAPSTQQLFDLAKFAGVRPKTLSDALMDDMAKNSKGSPQAEPKKAESRSPNKPVNNW